MFCQFILPAPTVPKRHMLDLKTRTTYECEYNDPIGQKPTQVRSIGKLYADDAIKRKLANGYTYGEFTNITTICI